MNTAATAPILTAVQHAQEGALLAETLATAGVFSETTAEHLLKTNLALHNITTAHKPEEQQRIMSSFLANNENILLLLRTLQSIFTIEKQKKITEKIKQQCNSIYSYIYGIGKFIAGYVLAHPEQHPYEALIARAAELPPEDLALDAKDSIFRLMLSAGLPVKTRA